MERERERKRWGKDLRHSQSHSATMKYHNFFDNSIVTMEVGGFEHSMPTRKTKRCQPVELQGSWQDQML